MQKRNSIGELALGYSMNPRTFKKHIRVILKNHQCTLIRNDKPLPQEVVSEIIQFMGKTEKDGSMYLKEIAAQYDCPYSTFRRQIEPIRHLLRSKARGRRLLSPRDVQEIYKYLGPP